jgi:hypothetical protein
MNRRASACHFVLMHGAHVHTFNVPSAASHDRIELLGLFEDYKGDSKKHEHEALRKNRTLFNGKVANFCKCPLSTIRRHSNSS